MKRLRLFLVVLFSTGLLLTNCGRKSYPGSSGTVYNILVPTSTRALRDVSLAIQGNSLIFIKNKKEIAALRINPNPPAPCDPSRCVPDNFRFTLINATTAVLFVRQPEMTLALEISQLPDDIVKDITSLENHSFSAQLRR